MTTFDFEDGNGPVPAHRHPNGGGWVADTATVEDTVYVGTFARVYGNAQISDHVQVYDRAKVYGNSQLKGDVRVCDNAEVFGNSKLTGTIYLGGYSYVCM